MTLPYIEQSCVGEAVNNLVREEGCEENWEGAGWSYQRACQRGGALRGEDKEVVLEKLYGQVVVHFSLFTTLLEVGVLFRKFIQL